MDHGIELYPSKKVGHPTVLVKFICWEGKTIKFVKEDCANIDYSNKNK